MRALNAAKLGKLLALASSDNDAEALAALRKVKAMLSAAGSDFVQMAQGIGKPAAPQVQTVRPASAGPSFADVFTGFDDHMEAKEPGWKAKRAAERVEKARRQAEYRAEVLGRYGSETAALAPCERERLLRAALAPWLVLQDRPWDRRTDNLDGWSGYWVDRKTPPHVRDAIANAYPLPTTFVEAVAEHGYWQEREREMEAALNFQHGDYALDMPCTCRWEMVRRLAEHELPVTSFADLLERSRMYRAMEMQCNDIEAALHRDLERLVGELSNLDTPGAGSPPVQSGHPARSSDRRARVLALLSNLDTAAWSDRAIAQAAGVSPSTVGKLRRSIGAAPAVRSVQRGGQIYRMKARP